MMSPQPQAKASTLQISQVLSQAVSNPSHYAYGNIQASFDSEERRQHQSDFQLWQMQMQQSQEQQ